MPRRARWCSIGCLSLALACVAKPAGEPVASEPVASEPVMFVEVPPDPAQVQAIDSTQSSATSDGASDEDRERAKALFGEGLALFEAGDLAEAIVRFEQAYQLTPLPALRFNIARTRAQLGDTLGACADYAELLADPEADDRIRESALHEITRLGC